MTHVDGRMLQEPGQRVPPVICRAAEYPALLLDHFREAAERAMACTEDFREAWQSEAQQQDRLLTSIIQLMVRNILLAGQLSLCRDFTSGADDK